MSISEVSEHYKTSSAANSALAFACSECGVPVSARIIQPYVPGRKITPSSGFRASDQAQPHTCDRVPQPTDVALSSSGSAPIHSTQRGGPERWVDPRKTVVETGGASSTTHPSSEVGGGSSRGRNGPAVGASVGQSQTVEKFAREWLLLSTAQRQSKPLSASWNVSGTYYGAFHPLKYFPKVSLGKTAIFVGTARYVTHYLDGYDIELNERTPGGVALHLWISTRCLSTGSAGKSLSDVLLRYKNTPASAVYVHIYALGEFKKIFDDIGNILSLDIEHPHMFWITE